MLVLVKIYSFFKSKICTITKVPHIQYGRELKRIDKRITKYNGDQNFYASKCIVFL